MRAMHIIQKPIVDLRTEPVPLQQQDYSHNPKRLTQLLFGQKVNVLQQEGDHLFVEAVEQEHYTEGKGWHGYQGFVHQSEVKKVSSRYTPTHVVSSLWAETCGLCLSYGTYLSLDKEGRALLADGTRGEISPHDVRPLHSPFCRKRLMKDALQFLGAPYLWGGSGAHGPTHISSVDCSGLIYLLYRAQGILIPRDAHPQALKGRKIAKEKLESGDLLYLRPEQRPGKHSHVLLYKDSKTYVEAPETGKCVREIGLSSDAGVAVALQGREGKYLPTYISFI